MEPHQKKDIKSDDALSTKQGNGTTSMLANNPKKQSNTLQGKQDNTPTLGATSRLDQVTPAEQRHGDTTRNTGHTVSVNADEQTTTSRALEDSKVSTHPLNDTTAISAASCPVEHPGDTHANGVPSIPLRDLIQDTDSLGALLGTVYNTTHSEEIKQVIACLVTLDIVITEQTRLNELHEAHTGKNFREQRPINKDRKLRLQETVNSVNTIINRLEEQLMALEIQVKQRGLRDNSHGLQVKSLHDRARMVAEGGEWVEQEIAEMKGNSEALQEEFVILKLENERLKEETDVMKKQNEEKIEDLEKEVNALKERDANREKRLAALEQLLRDKMESQ